MATIKPIEARSIHQIQSGQVIVDLCSVVKELVENSLDAGATSLEVRFRNNGLDCIEVQDNGCGISPSNYESLALKHYTSKLASYDDLSSLQTFGFRGEALSSLCALSSFYMVTALADEAPKGKRLDFESSGKLKDITVVAAQKGTTAVVEGLFEQLPVRRKELTKNIKKEYGKVLGLLHAYACISTNVKFTVRSSMTKGKSVTVFATKANPTTRENIANVYGAKMLSALVPLDLQLEFQRHLPQKKDADGPANGIIVKGHISRPVFGEGRQTPDRQMFFVNGRPCGLPQIAKTFNEVYRSFNVSQSPFIFADFEMDTNAYDVNVSPDKRTIMLHDSQALLEALKSSLTELFNQAEQTMPHSQIQTSRQPGYKQLTIAREATIDSTNSGQSEGASTEMNSLSARFGQGDDKSLLYEFSRNDVSTGDEPIVQVSETERSGSKTKNAKALEEEAQNARRFNEYGDLAEAQDVDSVPDNGDIEHPENIHMRDFNLRIAEQQIVAADQQPLPGAAIEQTETPSPVPAASPPRIDAVQNAFDRIRPTRPAAEIATITVGAKTITTLVGNQPHKPSSTKKDVAIRSPKLRSAVSAPSHAFTQRVKGFAAVGTPNAQMVVGSHNEGGSGDESQGLTPDLEDSMSEIVSVTASTETDDDGKSDDDAASNNVESEQASELDTDSAYVNGIANKSQENATVTELIRAAEETAILLNVNNARRGIRAMRGGSSKDSTRSLQVAIPVSIKQVEDLARCWQLNGKGTSRDGILLREQDGADGVGTEEERLALTVSKTDFSNMHIVGQFNLGFILAVRTSPDLHGGEPGIKKADELFIVDQHASDEKYNFEKLQEETVVGNQRLVHPKHLNLTAVEEEILIENSLALEKNGFLVSIDTKDDEPIGQKCKLVSLPLSKEVTFGLEDLEELLHLLAESPGLSQSSVVPRPSKVRKMFAMRACRSSIMIGKPLTEAKMKAVVSHMGEIDKPWNCPHGRPTMRHLMTLNSFETWHEGEGISGKSGEGADVNIWSRYAQD